LRRLELELAARATAGDKWRSALVEAGRWRDYYLRLFETAPAPLLVLNASGFIVATNRLSRQLLGLKPEKHTSVRFSECLIASEAPVLLRHLRDCLSKRKPTSITVKIRARGRSIQPARLTSVPFSLEPRGPELIHTVIADDAEHRRAEAKLKRQERHYQAFINSIEGVIWEADARTLQRTFVSRQAERLLGFAVEQWLYWPEFWRDHVVPEDRERVLTTTARAVAARENFVCEYRMLTAVRKVVWLRDCVTVLEDEGALRLRGISLDITELKQLEEEAKQARDRFQECLAKKLRS
jgi:PAS domain S-box-containing protein